MRERIIEVATGDGGMPVFLAHAEGAGPAPAVIVYMDGIGIRDELKAIARRIAGEGYVAVLPDLYYRTGTPVVDPVRPHLHRDRFMPLAGSITGAVICADTGALLDHLALEPAVAPGAKGCVGFCMGGRLAVTVAGTFPDAFAAASSLYGPGIVSDRPDSPHRLAGRITGEVYLGFAGDDEHVPAEEVAAVEAAFTAAGVRFRLDVFPGVRHGFAFPQRWCYDEAAAEAAYARTLDLFRRRLARPPR